MATPTTAANIPHRQWPKAELHLHIEGTLEPELTFELAQRNGVDLPWVTPEELRSAMEFEDLQSFLNLYYSCMAALRTRADFAQLMREYLRRAAADGVVHVEAHFDLQAHTVRGILPDDVYDGLAEGLDWGKQELGITGELILAFLRDEPPADALAALQSLAPRIEEGSAPYITAVGLDSAEVGYPPALFREVYAAAAELGLRRTAHAGEEAGPDYVWGALEELGVERVDHGLAILQDPKLLAEVRDRNLVVTMCPLSNVRLRAVDQLADHPLPELLEAGVRVTVNSDDPAYFGGYIGDNFDALITQFNLNADQVRQLCNNSLR